MGFFSCTVWRTKRFSWAETWAWTSGTSLKLSVKKSRTSSYHSWPFDSCGLRSSSMRAGSRSLFAASTTRLASRPTALMSLTR